jgi:hypothetical protein
VTPVAEHDALALRDRRGDRFVQPGEVHGDLPAGAYAGARGGAARARAPARKAG